MCLSFEELFLNYANMLIFQKRSFFSYILLKMLRNFLKQAFSKLTYFWLHNHLVKLPQSASKIKSEKNWIAVYKVSLNLSGEKSYIWSFFFLLFLLFWKPKTLTKWRKTINYEDRSFIYSSYWSISIEIFTC